MPAEGICLRVTHTGAVDVPILVTDIHDGQDPNGRVQNAKPGALYVPFSSSIDLIYTSQVAKSFEGGGIRKFIEIGYLTAEFVFGATFITEVIAESAIEVQDEGTTVIPDATVLNFVGGIVDATSPGPNQVDVTVTGIGGAIVVEDESIVIEPLTTALNFVGNGVTATNPSLGQVDVTVTTPTPSIVEITTTTYTVGTSDEIVLVNQTADSAVTITLPAGASHTVGLVTIKDKKGTAGTRNITINAAGGETVDGLASQVININYAARQLVWFGTEWSIV